MERKWECKPVYWKIFVNFANFSSTSFWAQNISIPPDQNLSIPIDQNVLILLISNICNGNNQTFGTENYAWILDLVQNFCEFCLSLWIVFQYPQWYRTGLLSQFFLLCFQELTSPTCLNHCLLSLGCSSSLTTSTITVFGTLLLLIAAVAVNLTNFKENFTKKSRVKN